MLTLSAHQPGYFPWLGFFDKMARSDVFVLLDAAQFTRGDFIHRNRIKTTSGTAWLTLPVRHGAHGERIDEARVSDHGDWQRRHWRSIEQHYARARYFDALASEVQDAVSPRPRLLDVLLPTIELGRRLLQIDTPIIRSSTLDVPGAKTEYLIGLCREFGATHLLMGKHGRDYLDSAAVRAAGVEVSCQHFSTPRYEQPFGEFVGDLSVIDVLLNCGPEAPGLLRGGRR